MCSAGDHQIERQVGNARIRGRDQYLSCWGIAGNIVSNCNDVSDPNDQQMCRGLSMRSQSPCTSMTDRNMQRRALQQHQ